MSLLLFSIFCVTKTNENEAAAKRRKSVLVKNDTYKSPSSPTPTSPPPPIKYHRSNFSSINEFLKLKSASHLGDRDNDESIENKENVNTDVIAID